MLTDLLLGISLAIDAFVVSLAIGIKQRHQLAWYWYGFIPVTFGLFQAGMPVMGWQAIAVLSSNWITRFDHWIAFILLVGIGLNMFRESLKSGSDDEAIKPLSGRVLLSLAVATSIDALAVGFTLPTVSSHPVQTIVVIGVVTSLVCTLGLVGTTYIPNKIGRPAEWAASFILIGLGVKMLVGGIMLSGV